MVRVQIPQDALAFAIIGHCQWKAGQSGMVEHGRFAGYQRQTKGPTFV